MKEDITIHGGKGAYAPGLMDWCMACTRKTFQKETMDVGARMFALAGFMPDVPAGQLGRIAVKAAAAEPPHNPFSINGDVNQPEQTEPIRTGPPPREDGDQ